MRTLFLTVDEALGTTMNVLIYVLYSFSDTFSYVKQLDSFAEKPLYPLLLVLLFAFIDHLHSFLCRVHSLLTSGRSTKEHLKKKKKRKQTKKNRHWQPINISCYKWNRADSSFYCHCSKHDVFCLSSFTSRVTSFWRWTNGSLRSWKRMPCVFLWTRPGTKVPGSTSSLSGSSAVKEIM